MIETKDLFQKSDLIPVIIQHWQTGEVLMLGFTNAEAYELTLKTHTAWFWSRSRQKLWNKGESSGNFLHVKKMVTDCDTDTLLYLCAPDGPTCHRGTPSCFSPVEHKWNFLRDLEVLLESRRNADPATSYTASLYARGTKRIAQKVGEEGVETALAATVHDREELRNEAADLVYHLLVLLADADLELADVIDVLRARHASREKAAEAK